MRDVLDKAERLLAESSGSLRFDAAGAGGLAAAALADAIKQLALSDLKRATSLAEGLARAEYGSARDEAQLLAARAHVLCYAARFDDALALLHRAEELANREGDMRGLGQVRLASVQPLARIGRLEDAERAARSAADALAEACDTVACGKSLLNLGIVLRMRGRLDGALAAFDEASALVAGDPLLLGALSSNRAEVLLDLDRFVEAQSAFESAAVSFDAAGNTHAAAIVEGNLADLLSRAGRFDEALGRFESARARFAAAGAVADDARLAAETAEALHSIGARDAALRAYAECLPALETAGLRRESARARLGLGLLLVDEGSHHEAHAVLSRAKEELLAVDATAGAGRAEVALAVMAIKGASRSEEARSLVSSSLESFERLPLRRAAALAEFARAALASGRPDEAAGYLRAVGATDGMPRPLRARLGAIHGGILRAQGLRAEAAEAFSLALREAESIRRQLHAERWRLAHGESWRDLYLQTASCALDLCPPRLDTAFDAIERMRGRTVLDQVWAIRAEMPAEEPDHAVALSAARSHAMTTLNMRYAALGSEGDGSNRGETAREIMRLEDEVERLSDRLAAITQRETEASEPMSLENARASLGESDASALFFAEGDSLSALVLTRDACTPVRGMASVSDVASISRRMDFVVGQALASSGNARRSGLDFMDLTKQLFARAIEPILALAPRARNLGVSPFGPLVGLPWGAFPVGDGVLADQTAVVEIPGLTVAHRLASLSGRAEPPSRVLAIGIADELAPRMEEEAVAVASVHAGSHVLLGSCATRDAVISALSEADLIHLASHVQFSSRHPLLSRLKVADGWLTVRELASAVRPGASVVLAGCESGRSDSRAHEDRQGFVRAVLAAGARHVVGARWPLHDETSVGLFLRLHHALRESASVPSALRTVQREFHRRGVSSWLWSGLGVTGGFP